MKTESEKAAKPWDFVQNATISLRQWLSKPTREIENYEDRINAQAFFKIILVLIPFGFTATIMVPIIRYSGSFLRDSDFRLAAFGTIFWISAMIITRQGNYRLATWISTIIACFVIYSSTFNDPQLKDLDFLFFPLFFSSIFLSTKETAYLLIFNLIGIFIFSWLKGDVTPIQITRTLSFVLTGSVLLYFGSNHRGTLESHRRKLLQNSITEKDTLLKEIHHRVKNNLQIVSSLINLQLQQFDEPSTRSIIEDSQNRIYSMALVHEKLYQTKHLARLDFGEYIRDLISSLANTFPGDITVKFELDTIYIDNDIAIPCGLILTELVSNSFKHAFPDKNTGVIEIILRETEANGFALIVRDDGIGIPEEMIGKKSDSLGLSLVHSLVHQLKGEISFKKQVGSVVTMNF